MPEDKHTLGHGLKVGEQRSQALCQFCTHTVEHPLLGDDLNVYRSVNFLLLILKWHLSILKNDFRLSAPV